MITLGITPLSGLYLPSPAASQLLRHSHFAKESCDAVSGTLHSQCWHGHLKHYIVSMLAAPDQWRKE